MLFVRHSEAVISASNPPHAWPLSTAGNRTAQELGRRLAGRFPEAIDVVVSSGERKAVETATALAGSPPTVDDRLGEVSKRGTSTAQITMTTPFAICVVVTSMDGSPRAKRSFASMGPSTPSALGPPSSSRTEP